MPSLVAVRLLHQGLQLHPLGADLETDSIRAAKLRIIEQAEDEVEDEAVAQ